MTAVLMNPEFTEDTDTIDRTLSRAPGILIADDMGLIMNLLKRELELRGFNVWLAANGNDALDLYWRHREQIDLVLLDVQMPDLDGPQTLAHLQQLDPNVVACFMTGNPGSYTERDLLQRGATCIFTKPFRMAELVDFLHKLVGTPDPTPMICCGQPTEARPIKQEGIDNRWPRL